MPLWLSVLILIISIVCILLLRKHFQKNKWLRIVSYVLLIIISAAMILYIAMTFILITRDDSGTSQPELESSAEVETPAAETQRRVQPPYFM